MKQKIKSNILPFAVLTLLAAGMILLIRFCNKRIAYTELETTLCSAGLGVAFLAAGAVFLAKTKEISENHIAAVLYMGFLLRVLFLIFTPASFFQNDMGAFEPDNYGNLGYVYILYTTGKLPALNPMEHYQLYHPPLHFAISAAYLRLLALLGVGVEGSAPVLLRFLSLLYCTGTSIVTDKLAKKLGAACEGRLVIACVISFLPYQVFLSGALNNDPLMLLLCMLSFYYAVCWYKTPTGRNILKLAVSIGLAMTTKISAALIAPAIGAVMLWKAWENRKEWLAYLKQFLLFGVVVFPLGMWYALLRLVQYGMPITYAPSLPEDSIQNISAYTVGQRLFDFGGAFDVLHIQWNRFEGFTDHNIFTTLIKYAVFGETSYDVATKNLRFFSTVAVAATGLLFLLLLVMTVKFTAEKRIDAPTKVLFLVTILLSLVMYVRFCFAYQFICAMNLRYILVAFYLGILLFGRTCELTNQFWFKKVVRIFLLLFVTQSLLLFFNLFAAL